MALALLACAAAQSPAAQLWPVPQSVDCTTGTGAVASSFFITTNDNSATLTAAITRYTAILAPLIGDAPTPSSSFTSMQITVTGGDSTLAPQTNYS